MKFEFKKVFFGLVFLINYSIVAQNIQVNDTYSAQQLIEQVLINSPCANVANFSITGDSFSNGQNSYGYFIANTSAFPFSEGIILTTGKATAAVGPNNSLLSEGVSDWLGDSDLEQALGISNSTNATVLEFDFTPITNKISFDYIFSSEQYLLNATSNQCNFTDGFAFLLKPIDNSAPYQNLAIVPGTTIPVKINTVRGTGSICPPANPIYFDAFNGSNHPTNFNGQTVVMKAEADVISGTTYHIKLVIADQGNELYDSAIFLGGGSFKSTTDLGNDHLVSLNNPYCTGEVVTLNATHPNATAYKWFKNGIDLGITTPTYTLTDTANSSIVEYSVEVTTIGTCISFGKVKIQFTPLPLLNDTISVQCDPDNDGITTFNLTSLNSSITNGNTALGNVIYYESLFNAQQDIAAITTSTSYQNANTNLLYAKVSNSFGCTNYAQVQLQISNSTIPNQPPINKCDDNQDGLSNFDLNQEVTPQLLLGLPVGLQVNYYLTENEALLQINPVPNSFNTTIPNQQKLFARVVNGTDCFGIKEVLLKTNSFNPTNFDLETNYLCDGSTITLSVPNTFESYLWNTNDTSSSILVSQTGSYSVTVTDVFGCEKTKQFSVLTSSSAVIIGIETFDFNGNENSILVSYSGSGDYEFSINGLTFQDSPLFSNVGIGTYFITIRDRHNCPDTVSNLISVLDSPAFFTPNGDGINEVWKIQNLPNTGKTKLYIYNRFGKLLQQINQIEEGWNGKINGLELPSDDYWFTLIFENNRIIKGHFALIR